jgi:hypothetical protein
MIMSKWSTIVPRKGTVVRLATKSRCSLFVHFCSVLMPNDCLITDASLSPIDLRLSLTSLTFHFFNSLFRSHWSTSKAFLVIDVMMMTELSTSQSLTDEVFPHVNLTHPQIIISSINGQVHTSIATSPLLSHAFQLCCPHQPRTVISTMIDVESMV